jgi:hypothetical protein
MDSAKVNVPSEFAVVVEYSSVNVSTGTGLPVALACDAACRAESGRGGAAERTAAADAGGVAASAVPAPSATVVSTAVKKASLRL